KHSLRVAAAPTASMVTDAICGLAISLVSVDFTGGERAPAAWAKTRADCERTQSPSCRRGPLGDGSGPPAQRLTFVPLTLRGRDARVRFGAGMSGNPRGEVCGETSSSEALLDGEGEAIMKKAIAPAKGGGRRGAAAMQSNC